MSVKQPPRPVGMPLTAYCRIACDSAAEVFGVLPDDFWLEAFELLVENWDSTPRLQEPQFIYATMLMKAEVAMRRQLEAAGTGTVQ